MRKTSVGIMLFLVFMLVSCEKKKEPLSKMQEPLNPEILTQIISNQSIDNKTIDNRTIISNMSKKDNISLEQVKELKNIPPSGPYKPTVKEIQTALKYAGFYDGPIDGIVGPKTKKAIEAFQKNNELKVDGIVGPKTWNKLKKYLESQKQGSD